MTIMNASAAHIKQHSFFPLVISLQNKNEKREKNVANNRTNSNTDTQPNDSEQIKMKWNNMFAQWTHQHEHSYTQQIYLP